MFDENNHDKEAIRQPHNGLHFSVSLLRFEEFAFQSG